MSRFMSLLCDDFAHPFVTESHLGVVSVYMLLGFVEKLLIIGGFQVLATVAIESSPVVSFPLFLYLSILYFCLRAHSGTI